MENNWLGKFFDFLGDSLERFNPSAFRFLAAALPYLTPIPVAWLTARSSAQFLSFTPSVSFVFVLALEGIGLWFTTMLVDAIVDWARSKNWRSIAPVVLLSITVFVYVLILVDINVTLESATGNTSSALSRVITLLCFLPLITGVGNGYYKLKLDYKTQAQIDKQREMERQEKRERQEADRQERIRIEMLALEEKARQEDRQDKLEKYRLRMEALVESSKKVPDNSGKFQESSNNNQKVSGKMESWKKVREKLSRDDLEKLANLSPDQMRQYASQTGFTYKTISNWKNNARNELEIRN